MALEDFFVVDFLVFDEKIDDGNKEKLIITILKQILILTFLLRKYVILTLWILTLVNSWKLTKLRNQYFIPTTHV